ncbi:hypothetical protein G7Y89_g12158 [Cudoniella acicularis]|uniref:Uncharacterized protein n=1 Tax=Cudoniella acicularis TaxID=354080 RepID=A0A8H4RC26_9HELO|nr:hypothetical protein G7Y89_g12158 [Cudoniella acicularis]
MAPLIVAHKQLPSPPGSACLYLGINQPRMLTSKTKTIPPSADLTPLLMSKMQSDNSWSEESPDDADYISLTLGSLAGSDLRDLEDLGLLPQKAFEDAENNKEKVENVVPYADSNNLSGEANEGLPWFETMVEGSRLGKMKKSRGATHSGNGRYKIEWEIVEWTDESENEVTSPGKRKLGEVIEDDSRMGEVH